MAVDEMTLFLDTNSLLHYPSISDVDWKAVTKAGKVKLVFCMQVIHELDEKKDHARLGERASRVIKEVNTIRRAGGKVRDDVALEIFNHEIRADDFPASLSYDSKDDRIVHSVKKYLEQNPGALVAVYTEDMGMALRCEANSISVLEPDTSKRLENPQSEQDKSYKLAITELNELKNRVPTVEVILGRPGTEPPPKEKLEFQIGSSLSERNLLEEFEAHQRMHNLYPMDKRELSKSGQIPTFPARHDAVEKYNQSLIQHLKDYKEWLELRKLLEQVEAHSITFSIWLANKGRSSAEEVDLQIQAGEPLVTLCEADSEEAKSYELPEEPKPPERPTQFFTDIASILGGLDLRPYELPDLRDLFLNKASVRRSDDGKTFWIEFTVPRLKPGDAVHVGNLIAAIDPHQIRPFHLNYRICAANLPTPILGKIPVIVRKAAGS